MNEYPELPTSTTGHYLSTFSCRVGASNEPAVGIQLREGFFKLSARLNLRQLEAFIDHLLDELRSVKSEGQQ